MSTNLGAIEVPGRPAGSKVWVAMVIVFALAVAALIVSAVALNRAGRIQSREVQTVQLWDAQKLEAMQGRELAETVGTVQLWDAQKLEAMQGRELAG